MVLPKQEPKQESTRDFETNVDTEDDWRTMVPATDSKKQSKKRKFTATDYFRQSKKRKQSTEDVVKEETPIKREKTPQTSARDSKKRRRRDLAATKSGLSLTAVDERLEKRSKKHKTVRKASDAGD